MSAGNGGAVEVQGRESLAYFQDNIRAFPGQQFPPSKPVMYPATNHRSFTMPSALFWSLPEDCKGGNEIEAAGRCSSTTTTSSSTAPQKSGASHGAIVAARMQQMESAARGGTTGIKGGAHRSASWTAGTPAYRKQKWPHEFNDPAMHAAYIRSQSSRSQSSLGMSTAQVRLQCVCCQTSAVNRSGALFLALMVQ
jgi:hypothetical protein